MAISAMNHFTVLTDDVPRTVHFYCNLLGLARRRAARPGLSRRVALCRETPRSCTSSAARRATN